MSVFDAGMEFKKIISGGKETSKQRKRKSPRRQQRSQVFRYEGWEEREY